MDLNAGQATNINCWNATNITAIKTEPRDTSPQPYSVYRGPPELTPSPQPLSPSNAYTHNTPSPYNMATTVTTGTQANQQLISPNQQYKYNAANRGGGNNINPNVPPPMDISDYNAFSQQTQQQQFHANNYGGAGASHWETKFNPASAAGNNLSNLNNANTFTMHNLLTPSNAAGGAGNGSNGNGTSWNLHSNNFLPHPHHLQQLQQQQQYQQHQATNDGVATSNNAALTNVAVTSSSANNANNNEHGLSNLLNFDSEQLVRINSEDQQMLRLNSEDLQISNLSIST